MLCYAILYIIFMIIFMIIYYIIKITKDARYMYQNKTTVTIHMTSINIMLTVHSFHTASSLGFI